MPASITFAQNLDALKAGVVKIKANSGQIGTGFIVRVEPEVVYIITAAHVIAGDPQPEVAFFSSNPVAVKAAPAQGSVLPGAQVADELRGLAVLVVRGKENIPDDLRALAFESSTHLVSGGEEALVIGHPGGGGDWAIVKRDISNRVVHDIMLDPGVASRYSGGPIIVNAKVVGMVMSNRGEFGLGITHKSLLNYLEGIGIEPGSSIPRDKDRIPRFANEKKPEEHKTLLPTLTGKDGATMVLVAAGAFTMGSPEGEGDTDEHPKHTVYLDDFYIDQYEVTVERYQRFMKDENYEDPRSWDQVQLKRDGQKPIVGIDWQDAQAYCQWAGRRLPSEAEWEKAARGMDKRTYPWGESKPTSSTANFGKDTSENFYSDRLKNVGTYEQGQSPYGAYDMAGNVWEWVADGYAEDYYRQSPQKNPKGASSKAYKVLRGGSWFNPRTVIRSANRKSISPTRRDSTFGIRCAKDAGSPAPFLPQKHSPLSSERTSQSLSSTQTGNDGAMMVLVPAGEFMMGSPEGGGDADEHPQHPVELEAFYLDKHEVTNQQFQKFVETTDYRTTAEQKGSAYGYSVKDEWKDISGANWRQPEGESSVFASGRGMHPVVAVSWEDAMAYCLWVGKRLPTEAEWEYAARAGTTNEYWWGTGGPGSRKVGNFADETVKQRFTNWTIMEGYEDSYLRTAPVGVFEANPWGLHDMAGNVWEWVMDWYDAEYYGKHSRPNPQGPDKGEYRIFRGGSWSDKPQDLRLANREKGAASIRRATNGFRCAANAF